MKCWQWRCVSASLGILGLISTMSLRAQTAQVTTSTTGATTNSGSKSDGDLEEIVVTGLRASLESAQRKKRDAAEVIEAITPEDLGKFTDNNIGDQLQRLPGVQIDPGTDGRSGDHVAIRGMGAEYITTTVNGRQPGGYGYEGVRDLREFAVDILPTEILAGAEVYKTSSAELLESGIGGEVEYKTLKPLDYVPESGNSYYGNVTVKGTNDSGTGDWGRGVSTIIGDKFFDNTLGVYFAGLWNNSPEVQDFIETRPNNVVANVANAAGQVSQVSAIFPNDIDLGRIFRETHRTALSTDVEWKPNDFLTFNADYTRSKYDRDENRDYNTYFLDGGVAGALPGVFQPGGITVQNGAVTGLNYANYKPPAGGAGLQPYDLEYPLLYNNDDDLQIGGLNGKWTYANWTANLDLSFDRLVTWQNLAILSANPVNLTNATYSGNTSGPPTIDAGQPPLTNPALFNSSLGYAFERYFHTVNGGEAARLDFTDKFSDKYTLKFGARFTTNEDDTRAAANFTNGPSVSAANAAAINAILYPGGIDSIFPGQNLGINAQPHANPLGAYTYAISHGILPGVNLGAAPFTGPFANIIGATQGGNWGPQPNYDFDVREKTQAGYLQLDGKGEIFDIPASGNVGLRLVHTSETTEGFQSTFYQDVNGFETRPISTDVLVSQTNSYNTFLPAANLNMHPREDINVRFGIGRTMSRPEYQDLSPQNSIGIPDPKLGLGTTTVGSATVGNTALKPTTAWNYDGSIEFYEPTGAFYSASIFIKRISDFIAPNAVAQTMLPGQGAQLFNTTVPQNVSDGHAYGYELGFNQPLKVITDYLNGFGFQANYTYVDSAIDAPQNGYKVTFPGASRNNVNGTLYFDNGPFDARVALIYRSAYLSQLPWAGVVNYNLSTDASTRLDASASYKIFRNLQLTVAGTNLTAESRRDYVNNTANFLNYYTVPRAVAIALRGSF